MVGRWLEGGGEQRIYHWKVVREQRKVVEDKRNPKKTIGRWWKLAQPTLLTNFTTLFSNGNLSVWSKVKKFYYIEVDNTQI